MKKLSIITQSQRRGVTHKTEKIVERTLAVSRRTTGAIIDRRSILQATSGTEETRH